MSAHPIHMQVNSPELMRQHRAAQERKARIEQPRRASVFSRDACAHVLEWKRRQWGLYCQNERHDAHVIAYHTAKRPIPAALIIATVAKHFNVNPADILSDCRKLPYVRPRQVAMYLYRTVSRRSFPEIGFRFRRDHTTALSNCRKIARLLAEGHPIAQDVEALRSKLRPHA